MRRRVRDASESQLPHAHPHARVRTVALITSTEPEPRSYGKLVVLGGMLDHFCARLGARNVHVVLIARPDIVRPMTTYRLHLLDKPSAFGQLTAVARHVVLPAMTGRHNASCALQEAVVRSPALGRALSTVLDEIDADLEVWDTLRVAQYAPQVTRRRRVLYADDLFSERYASMLDGKVSTSSNVGGEFGKLLPEPVRRLLGNPRVYRPLLRVEKHLVARSETRQPHWFDSTLLISPAETARLRARCPGPRIETLPPLLREPRRVPRAPDYNQPTFTFVGAFSYALNVDGLEWFLRECWPGVARRMPNALLDVVGSGSEVGVDCAHPWRHNVRFLGFVKDIDTLFSRSMALISPLQSGSGVKIKVLEALARGVPVVATRAGVHGIEGPERSGCMVADDPDAFAACMQRVCSAQTNAMLSHAARAAWEERHAPALVRRRYDALFGLPAPQPPLPMERS